MEINWLAVTLATLSQFFVGAVWYMVIFTRQWQEIHGMGKLSQREMAELDRSMRPYYGMQLVSTAVTSYVLALLIGWLPHITAFEVASWLWLGLVVPTQVSAVMFGGTKTKWITTKLLIMAGGSLACLMSAAGIIQAMN